uniref:5-methylthioadenosine/S-adenosylhomocysteine deaminase n=1 Tax=Lygus hesperus TaxID=30085 RepID=A0A0A9YNF5_LYGHE
MTLLRGYSDDKLLMDWLQKDIWPCEGKFANDRTDFIYVSSLLGIAEMIRSGTTCYNDMYNYPGELARATAKARIRGVIGGTLMTQDWLPPIAEQFTVNERVMEEYRDTPLITFSCAPHAPYTVNDEMFVQCRDWMTRYTNTFMHLHLHETKTEVSDSIVLTKVPPCHLSDQAMSPLNNLHRLQLVNSRLTAVHMTALTDDEIAL